MIALIVLSILIAAYLTFVLGPAIAMFCIMFGRKTGNSFDNHDYTGTYYEPCMPRAIPAMERMKARALRTVTIESEGVTLSAEYLDRGSDKTAILLHGYNATPFMNFSVPGEALEKQGFNLLFVSERAHGKSGGRFGSFGILEAGDAVRWAEYAQETLGAREILLWGMSMGAAAVAFAAPALDPETVRGLIIDCGFTSPEDVMRRESAKRGIPWKLLYPIIRRCARLFVHVDLRERTVTALSKCRIPVMFIHGEADSSVPLSDSIENYEACASEKELYTVPAAGHTCAYTLGGDEAEERLSAFLRRYFL